MGYGRFCEMGYSADWRRWASFSFEHAPSILSCLIAPAAMPPSHGFDLELIPSGMALTFARFPFAQREQSFTKFGPELFCLRYTHGPGSPVFTLTASRHHYMSERLSTEPRDIL